MLKRSGGKDGLVMVVLALGCVAIGVVGIGWGLPSTARSRSYPTDPKAYESSQGAGRIYDTAPYDSRHPDEAALLGALSNMQPGSLDFDPHYFVYPTAWIYATGATLEAADVTHVVHKQPEKADYVGHPDEARRIYEVGRLLAVLAAALGVVLLYALVRRLRPDDRWLAVVAAVTLAISPIWVRNERFMLTDIPAVTVMCAVALLAHIAYERRSSRLVLAAVVLAGLAASTKYPAGMAVLLPLLVWWWLRRDDALGPRWRRPWIALPTYVVGLGVGFLAGTPYAVLDFHQFRTDLQFLRSEDLGSADLSSVVGNLSRAAGTTLVVLGLAGLVLLVLRRRDRASQFVLLWAAAGVATTAISSVTIVRYLLPLLPPLAIGAATALDELRRRLAGRGGLSPAATSVLVLVLLVPTAAYSATIEAGFVRTDPRDQASAWITGHVRPGSTVGTWRGFTFDLPAVSDRRYRMVQLADHRTAQPDVVIMSATPAINRHYASTYFHASHWLQRNRYTEVRFHAAPPGWLSAPNLGEGTDWVITYPDVRVYVRTAALLRPGS